MAGVLTHSSLLDHESVRGANEDGDCTSSMQHWKNESVKREELVEQARRTRPLRAVRKHVEMFNKQLRCMICS
jgi:hypothetical protein